MVLQEERNHNNGCRRERSGFMPKKHKANKVPQRGLGIAALEKLRREDQQSRIAGWFSAGDNTTTATASTGGSVHLSSGVISPAPFLPALEQSTKPCFFGSSPLFGNSVQSESSSISSSRLPLLPRKLQEGQQRYSLLIRNFLSPPMSSGASLQIEPPSNQSYVSINPPSMPVQKFANLKRSWAFHPGSALESGNDPKRIALSRLELKQKLLSLMEACSAWVFCLFQNRAPCKQYHFINTMLIICNIFRKTERKIFQKLLVHPLFTISWACLMISLMKQIQNPKMNSNTDYL
ncbi:uncharacterized protein LOC110035902 isoform X2 [Phalaenopsis equestris]|uniref:uncharacterized protein LOC110035902 isoform X2 n=1 Tax=Phalaenopsis equestris TaxID=78828 RepID=UPI0009E5027A|nr:uncharacterized protein LOC110035902 isoform X2 [Phalaenopsis equestris]